MGARFVQGGAKRHERLDEGQQQEHPAPAYQPSAGNRDGSFDLYGLFAFNLDAHGATPLDESETAGRIWADRRDLEASPMPNGFMDIQSRSCDDHPARV